MNNQDNPQPSDHQKEQPAPPPQPHSQPFDPKDPLNIFPKQSLNVLESATGAVPSAEGNVARPTIKVAQNLMEQIEYFKLSYKLRFSHILWMGMATYICYDRYTAFANYRGEKSQIFSRNRKAITDKYGNLNLKYTQSVINPRGDPDQGDWVYFKELSEVDQQKFLESRANFLDQSAQFNAFMPLYITSGICFPFSSLVIGLLFRNKVFPQKQQVNTQMILNSNSQNKDQAQIQVSTVNNNQNSEIESTANGEGDNINEEAPQAKKKWFGGKASIDSITNNVSLTNIYGAMTGFALISCVRIVQSFIL